MRKEEEALQNFIKENDLKNLDFSWGTNTDRYYVAHNSEGEEVRICYNVSTESITSRRDR